MFKSYLLVAWRNLLRRKSFSIINITGLSIGMAAAVLILLWIQHEVSFDRFYDKQDRLYEVYNKYDQGGEINCWRNTPKVMAAAIQKDYPEIEMTARVNFVPPVMFSAGEQRISARGNLVDSTFLQVFSFPLKSGNAVSALDGLYSIVITEGLAKSLFGNEDAMGKIVRVDNRDNFTVTGVLKELPNNSRFKFEFLASWAYLRKMDMDDQYWGNNSTATYAVLKPNVTLASLAPKLKTLRKRYDKGDPNIETFLYPISRSHLHGEFKNGVETGGKIEVVQLFGLIAGLILLIACINFMNLSTARSEKRAREVGVRKVVGAQKRSLVAQFLGESVLLSVIAGVIALLIVQVSLPAFNELVDKELSVHFGNVWFWMAAIGFILFTGILAGSYPAVYLSSFKPVSVIKGAFKATNALITPRKVLVVAQFTFAIVLIIATIIVRQQISKAQKRQTGYAANNLVYHFMEGDVEKNYMLIKNELMSAGVVTSMTKTLSPITENWSNSWSVGWKGKPEGDKTVINRFNADDAIAKTAGLTIVKGRDLDIAQYPTDSLGALINERAAKVMGFKDPIGQTISDMGFKWHVVGVVKDFIVTSPYHPIEPLVISGAGSFFNVIHFRLNPAMGTDEAITAMTKIFKKYNSAYPFNYRFVDEEYGKKFGDEKRTATLASLFALLTIIISCLGLFGLASYMAENRTREIGIRKVLGASVASLASLLSVEFLKLVLIAFVIAAPLGYWAMSTWLQNFPYRVNIQWWVFGLAGLLAVVISLITVGFQAIKAALMNPVKSLRSE